MLKTQTIMTLNVKPLGDRILLEAVHEKTNPDKKSGIIIPESAREKPMESRVIAVGTGKTGEDGKKIPFDVKKGDIVLASRYGGTEIKLNGTQYRILNAEEVLAILD